ncbi:hypothetical protein D3C80_1684410 [compost metagenome]
MQHFTDIGDHHSPDGNRAEIADGDQDHNSQHGRELPVEAEPLGDFPQVFLKGEAAGCFPGFCQLRQAEQSGNCG